MKERLDRLGTFLVSAFKLTALVGIYFKTERLPVLFLLYIAITAMTRFLAVDVKEIAVLVLQIASSKFATAKAEAKVL